MSKKAVGVMVDLANILKNSSYICSRVITISKNDCFNYHKIGHFSQDYKFPDYHTLKKINNSSSNIR